MKLNQIALASLAATTLMTGCGGGGGDGFFAGNEIKPGQTINFVQPLPASKAVTAGSYFDLAATVGAYSAKLSSMEWKVIPEKASLPPMDLSNTACEGGSRSSVAYGKDLNASRWSCQTGSVAPLVKIASNYKVIVTGKDEAGNFATSETTISVAPLNELQLSILRPTIIAPASILGKAGTTINAVCLGKENSGGSGNLTYAWSIVNNTSGRIFSIDQATGPVASITLPQLSVTDSNAEAVVRCIAKDSNGFENSIDTTITAAAVTTAPPVITATGSMMVTVGQAAQLSCRGAGGYLASDESKLTYQWIVKSNPDNVGVITANAGTSTLSAFVPVLPIGKTRTQVVYECRVTDDAMRTTTVEATVDVVENASTKGVVQANAGTSKTATPGSTVTLDATATTVIGGSTATPLFYSWKQIDGPAVTISSANSATATFLAPTVTTAPVSMKFQVVVTRTPQAAEYKPEPNEVATVEILVGGRTPPVIKVSDPQTVAKGASVSVTASSASDGATTGSTLFYRWTQISGAPVTLQGQTTATASFFAPQTATTVILRVQASADPTFPPVTTAYNDVVVKVE